MQWFRPTKLWELVKFRGESGAILTLDCQIASSVWLIREVSELSTSGETITKTISWAGLL